MEQYKKEFIIFLLDTGALRFGEFTTKSGRRSPYFINTGLFRTGRQLQTLGNFYASRLLSDNIKPDVVFGPAYKGIPLCCSLAMALSEKTARDTGYVFNRKETKTHGESGLLIGSPLGKNTKLVIIDDVITAGLSINESITLLKKEGNPCLEAVIIAVDRKEKEATIPAR